MKIKLEKQGTIVIVRAAIDDINPTTGSIIKTMEDLKSFYKNINKELQKKPGCKWFTEIEKLKRSFSHYKGYKFYENGIRDAIIASLGLKKRADDCFVSLSYTNIDDFSQALQKGYEWLLINKDSIKEKLQDKAIQEQAEIKRELSDLINQEISGDEEDIDHEAMMRAKRGVSQQ